MLSGFALALLAHTLPGMILSMVVLNIGLAFSLTALPNLVVEGVPPEVTSAATGVNVVARTAFAGVGTAIGTLLVSQSLVPGTQFGTASAYVSVYVFVGVCALGAFLVGLALRTRSAAPQAPAAQPLPAAGI